MKLLKPQLISERFKQSHSFTKSKPSDPLVKAWQLLHGTNLTAYLSLIIGVTSVISSIWYQIEWSKLQPCIFLGGVFYVNCEFMLWFYKNRSELDDLYTALIKTSMLLEQRSNDKQVESMLKMTRFVRIVCRAYGSDVFVLIMLYMVYPLQQNQLACPMPFLPDDHFYFWISYFFQSLVLITGPVAGFTGLTANIEISLCLTTLFRVLAEQFESVSGRKAVNKMIKIHQSLLDSLLILREFLSHVLFSLILISLCCLVINTYVTLKFSVDALMLFVIPSVLGFVFIPCLLSEMISTACTDVGLAAYKSDWVNDVSVRQHLALVINRSNRSSELTGGMFGNLGMAKYQEILSRWYQFVQAMLNLN